MQTEIFILRANFPKTWIPFDFIFCFVGNSCIIAILPSRVCFNVIIGMTAIVRNEALAPSSVRITVMPIMTLKHTLEGNIAYLFHFKSIVVVYRAPLTLNHHHVFDNWTLFHCYQFCKHCFYVFVFFRDGLWQYGGCFILQHLLHNHTGLGFPVSLLLFQLWTSLGQLQKQLEHG